MTNRDGNQVGNVSPNTSPIDPKLGLLDLNGDLCVLMPCWPEARQSMRPRAKTARRPTNAEYLARRELPATSVASSVSETRV
jgi:hypothetical protein